MNYNFDTIKHIKTTSHIFKQFYIALFKNNFHFDPKYFKVTSWIDVFDNLEYHISLIAAA
jgi:hypothetical protein